MQLALTSIILLVTLLVYPPKTQAIIILPALILIPIAQILASLIGFLSVPLAALALISKKIFKHSPMKTAFFLLLSLVVIVFLVAIILKITNPDRPWF